MLGNERFVARAPAELVDAEREKVRRFADERDLLAEQIEALGT
jgi:hypothetical protein